MNIFKKTFSTLSALSVITVMSTNAQAATEEQIVSKEATLDAETQKWKTVKKAIGGSKY